MPCSAPPPCGREMICPALPDWLPIGASTAPNAHSAREASRRDDYRQSGCETVYVGCDRTPALEGVIQNHLFLPVCSDFLIAGGCPLRLALEASTSINGRSKKKPGRVLAGHNDRIL